MGSSAAPAAVTSTGSRGANACAGATLALGALALGGWLIGQPILGSLSHAYVPMAPNTALAFALSAGAVLARNRGRSKAWQRVALIGSLAVLVLAVATLIQWFVGADWGVDAILVDARVRRGPMALGVMSPLTAVAFVPLAIALAIDATSTRLAAWRNGLASISFLAGALFALGYAFGAPLLYSGGAIPMALTTAFGFITMGTGVLALSPHDAWPVRLVIGDNVHARLLRGIVPLVLGVVIVQSWLELIASRSPYNPALLTALVAGAAALGGALVVGRVALSIARSVERAEAAASQAATALHRTEEQLQRAQRMESVGRLAGGVAHDFNNMLSVIITQTELLLARRGIAESDTEALREIREAAERSAKLSRQLLAMSRRQVLEPMVMDVNGLVQEMMRLLERIVGEDFAIVARLAAEPARVKADPAQLEQVLMNLVVNARDAMPSGGRIAIETSLVELDAAFTAAHPELAPGSHVVVAVSDTGVGMSAETRSHIFEPFFTTKQPGKGTGLGLSIVYGIVKQSGGSVSVESEPGRGTTFRIYLPRSEAPVSSQRRSAPPKRELAGKETVLLIEDEELVRRAARRVLAQAGYQVIEAASGEAALKVAGAQETGIDVVLTDLVMPGLAGRALIRELRSVLPTVSVVVMSGYSSDHLVQSEDLSAGDAFVQKPFTPAALLGTLRDVLELK